MEEGGWESPPGEIGPISQDGMAFGYREESAKSGRTLFGSFTSIYFPSGCFMHRSIIDLIIPHPLTIETFS